MIPPPPKPRSIELLSPAGDWDCVTAAIENGADAIYFGLDCGFNARHRAKNFGLSDLEPLAAQLRTRGVRGYVTMNTLVFPSEMPALVDTVVAIAKAGIDAVLVQDFGVARLVRKICPELEVHASTQMSLTSAETIAVAAQLGLSRVVLARELSVQEIRTIAQSTQMPLEVFIHGALCVAYSGQCLTSESLGGRSANRGQCAQACRLPYELICDGEDRPLDEVRYLLSPQDLAGYQAIPDLIDAGVASIKIEGRLKTPEYVANITRHYRRAIDDALRSGQVHVDDQSRQEMELSFSRGFSPGWLEGNDHKRLVPGLNSAKRGIELGHIEDVAKAKVRVTVRCDLRLGDGLAIETSTQGLTNDPGETHRGWQGGRVYGLSAGKKHGLKSVAAGQTIWVEFGRGDLDWESVQVGQRIYKNDDPQLNRRLRQSYQQKNPVRRQRLDVQVVAEVGKPLRLIGDVFSEDDHRRLSTEVQGDQALESATKRPITEAVLREQLARLGGTAFELGNLEPRILGDPMVPMSMLNQLRRRLVDQIQQRLLARPERQVNQSAGRALLDPIISSQEDHPDASEPARLIVLCRNLQQLEAACSSGATEVYVDFHDIRQYGDAVQLARQHRVPIAIAMVRMQKPGEMGLLKVLLRHDPDAVLVRNLAGLAFFRDRHPVGRGIKLIGDFSLNVANHRSAQWLFEQGLRCVTASYDLNRPQLIDLVDSIPSDWVEVVVHQHMPMFHMEHCVFCSVLSPGTNKSNCGRPCDDHVVELRDRVGAEHSLHADVACRNTLYNATPQSGAELVSDLIQRGVKRYRIELLDQSASQTRAVIDLYQRLIAGQISGRQVWQQLKAANRVGVTRGTLEEKRNPLAIL